MKWQTKVLIVIALIIAVVVVVSWKGSNCCDSCSHDSSACPGDAASTTQPASTQPASSQPASASAVAPPAIDTPIGPLPRLVELGSTKCIPCKRMEPILDELRREYAGRMQVEFFDVRRNPEIGESYGIRVIPTQIFISADGEELWRHEGFIPKDDILAKWRELGVTFSR